MQTSGRPLTHLDLSWAGDARSRCWRAVSPMGNRQVPPVWLQGPAGYGAWASLCQAQNSGPGRERRSLSCQFGCEVPRNVHCMPKASVSLTRGHWHLLISRRQSCHSVDTESWLPKETRVALKAVGKSTGGACEGGHARSLSQPRRLQTSPLEATARTGGSVSRGGPSSDTCLGFV